ncbi:hypothetical protein DFH94DRAFT_707293 [Russula ochroleuca]|uniref:Uncharacterized protein n=1 Tax=Russula ochroleuca TaxID=152965 RepID=A0A9P5TCU8_9AGAM|nr:hypothetical protein DFH94DRAFT_707293 [Russula ochroleuca]
MHTYTIRFVTIFFLITSQSVSCTLRSRARVHAHWHTFVLVVENVVLAIVGMAQSCPLRRLHRGTSIRALNPCSPFPHPIIPFERKNAINPLSSCRRPDKQHPPLRTSN